jgi:hypothetical protein
MEKMRSYHHTQRGDLLRRALLLGSVVTVLAILLPADGAQLPILPGVVLALVLGALTWLMGSLTISVADGYLSWSFGPGFLKKTVAVGDIVDAVAVETTLWQGWGIHLTRRGWLYNVSGHDAVWIRLRSGKQFVLGSDEPHQLISAIRAARSS